MIGCEGMLSEFWAEWFSPGRELGNPSRWLTDDYKDFIDFAQNSKGPVYMSTSIYDERNHVRCLSSLFFDFDCKEDPDKAWEDVFYFTHRLGLYYNIVPLITFSGRKGYHVHVFLEEPLGWNLSQEHMKSLYGQLQKMLIGRGQYPTLDPAVLGDFKRLARVPYTLHEKTGAMCIPIDRERRSLMLQPGFRQAYREHGLSYEVCEKARQHVNDEILDRVQPRRTRNTSFDNSLRPCIQAALESSHVEHKMRVAVVAELNADGWSQLRIVDAFSGLSDFDRHKTETYVKHALKKRYSPFKCTTIQTLGGCLGSDCPIYRRKGK